MMPVNFFSCLLLYRCSLFALLLCVSQGAYPVSSSSTAPVVFIAYEQARVFNQVQLPTALYELALGAYKKRQGRWQPEKSLRLRGKVWKQTHEFVSGTNEWDLHRFYRDQIPAEASILFECEGRRCGPSNSWANNYFKVKQLYGFDQYQRYVTYQLSNAHYLTIYTVRRGNGRVYVQLEQVQLEQIDAAP